MFCFFSHFFDAFVWVSTDARVTSLSPSPLVLLLLVVGGVVLLLLVGRRRPQERGQSVGGARWLLRCQATLRKEQGGKQLDLLRLLLRD